MRKYIFTEKSHTFKRINKKTARTAYKNGLTVIICPCNLRPFTPWHNEHRLNRKDRAQFVIDEIGVINDRFTGEAPTPATLGTVEQYDYSYMQQ